MHVIRALWILSLLMGANLVFAASMPQPLRDPLQLLAAKKETVVGLSQAQVLLADYDLIRKDFPQIQHLSDPQIDRWLLDNVAYVSIPQSNQNVVNTPIPQSPQQRNALRPDRYNRALVFEVLENQQSTTPIGLIDVKGSGSLRPSRGHHSNGLSTLGEAVREFIYENMIREVLEDSGLNLNTVGSYAVIDPGFDIIHDDHTTSRAGLYLRQAHSRNSDEWIRGQEGARIEKTLNRYGIYVEGNIQGTKGNDVLDFGHYTVKNKLPSDGFPEKRIPFDVWGIDESVQNTSGMRWFHAKYERPWYYSHQLADAWASGQANRESFTQHYRNMLGPIKDRLNRHGNHCSALLMRLL